MKRTLLLIIVFCLWLIPKQVDAQCLILNQDFEMWASDTFPGIPPIILNHPVNWDPLLGWFGLIFGTDTDANLKQSTDAHGGSFSAKLEPDPVNTDADMISVIDCDERPASMGFHYKFVGTSGLDTMSAVIALSRYDSQNDSTVPVGFGSGNLPLVPTFIPAVIPISYMDPGTPDTAILYFNFKHGGPVVAFGLVDDVHLTSGPVGIDPVEEIGLSIYPNPASDFIAIDLGNSVLEEASIIYIYNSNGSIVDEAIVTSGIVNKDITSYPPGIYFAELRSGDSFIRKKFVKL